VKDVLTTFILAICLLNLVRIGFYLVSSDAYSLKQARQRRRRPKRLHFPTISVVVPARNEEQTIERNLQSLYNSCYPADKLEVIIVNDGSTDKTAEIVRQFQKTHKDRCNIRLVNRPNKGKAAALNYALRRCVRNNLIMCLDADSAVDKCALHNAAQHFRDRQVVALASNVNIIEDGSMLALIQRFEYLVCYQMKKAQALCGLEYIVGGIGSMFRRSMLQRVAFYDTNTMTEDIDLTMKIIVNKTKKQKIAYAADSIVYTEPAHSLPALLRQRFRWKYGRNQTYYKNGSFFFGRSDRHAKRLSWFMLPFTLVQDFLFMFEPLILGFFLYISLRTGDPRVFNSAIITITVYLLCNLWSSDHLSVRHRLRLSYYAPAMYLLMFLLSFAEYFALIKALVLTPKLKMSLKKRHFIWRSPERKQAVVTAA
jgi:poly-beta-1,6-N-acetyl-D-glucosamine synthase